MSQDPWIPGVLGPRDPGAVVNVTNIASLTADRLPGFRRLTRDSRNRRLTRDSRIPDFSRKNFRKNRKNPFFGLLGPK